MGTMSPPWLALGLSLCMLVHFGACGVIAVSSACSHRFSFLAFRFLLCFYVSSEVGKSLPDNTIFRLQRNLLLPNLLPSPQEHL